MQNFLSEGFSLLSPNHEEPKFGECTYVFEMFRSKRVTPIVLFMPFNTGR